MGVLNPYRTPAIIQDNHKPIIRGPSRWSMIKSRLRVIEWGFVCLFLLATVYGISASAIYGMVSYKYATMHRLIWVPYAFTSILALITGVLAAYFVIRVIKESQPNGSQS